MMSPQQTAKLAFEYLKSAGVLNTLAKGTDDVLRAYAPPKIVEPFRRSFMQQQMHNLQRAAALSKKIDKIDPATNHVYEMLLADGSTRHMTKKQRLQDMFHARMVPTYRVLAGTASASAFGGAIAEAWKEYGKPLIQAKRDANIAPKPKQ